MARIFLRILFFVTVVLISFVNVVVFSLHIPSSLQILLNKNFVLYLLLGLLSENWSVLTIKSLTLVRDGFCLHAWNHMLKAFINTKTEDNNLFYCTVKCHYLCLCMYTKRLNLCVPDQNNSIGSEPNCDPQVKPCTKFSKWSSPY